MTDAARQRASVPEPDAQADLTSTCLASPYLSDDERYALEAVTTPPRPVRANTDLVREGDMSDQLHILIAGWACRYKITHDGSRQIVALLVPGDAVNLDALMFRRSDYGVRMLTAAKVVTLPCDRVLSLADRHSGIAKTFTRLAMVENAILSQWALCLGRHSAQQRLAHLLCELGVRLAGGEREAAGVDIPLTQEHLADALGLTPVHVNRTLQRLRREGLVAGASRTVTLRDMARLSDKAEFDSTYLHREPDAADTRRDRSDDGRRDAHIALAMTNGADHGDQHG